MIIIIIFDRVCAPPHAAVRGGVPAVCLPLDEQPPNEGAATTLHDQAVGHLPGTDTRTQQSYCDFCYLSISIYLALHGISEKGFSLIMTSDCLRCAAFVIPTIIPQPTLQHDTT